MGSAHKLDGNLKAKGKMTPRTRVVDQNWPFLQLVNSPHYIKPKIHYHIKNSVHILSRNESEYIIKVDFTRMRYEGLKRIKRPDKVTDSNCSYHTLQWRGTFSCFFVSWMYFHHCLASNTRPSFPPLNLQALCTTGRTKIFVSDWRRAIIILVQWLHSAQLWLAAATVVCG